MTFEPVDITPVQAPPAVAADLFGNRLPLAARYAEALAGAGVVRGLIGPRELDRLWDRHLLNCAVLTDLLPQGARIVDVGSGAGLPGLVLAIRRPDLQVELVEPLLRRSQFLTEVADQLGLTGTVRVVRGRAEEPATVRELGGADWVTARAVAPLDRLVKWCLPLLAPGGHLLALKGRRAAEEVAEHRPAIRRLGTDTVTVRELGSGVLVEPTWVVEVRRSVQSSGAGRVRRSRKGGS